MKIKFLGTGTSQGVPVLGSHDPVSLSNNPKDKRLRTSAILTTDTNHKILIDCGPDFRQQMLANKVEDVEAVLITHEHNDHVIGLDDLRPIIFKNEKDMPIYCMERVASEIQKRFPYAFAEDKYPSAPSFEMHPIKGTFTVNGTDFTSIDILHGDLPIYGYKCKNLVYITDGKTIPEKSREHLKNLDVLIINCLRKEKEHHSHFILPEVLAIIKEFQPKRAYLTHMSQEIGFHEETQKLLPENVFLAYDGLEIDF